MRVNIYAEEMTERVEIISKEIDGTAFTGLRLYLELPTTLGIENGRPHNVSGPFIHRPDDDDSAAVTFWGKRDLRKVLRIMLDKLDAHYGNATPPTEGAEAGVGATPESGTVAQPYTDEVSRKVWDETMAPLPDRVSVPRAELEWIASQYDDHESTGTLASRLYDVSCTAKELLNMSIVLQAAQEGKP